MLKKFKLMNVKGEKTLVLNDKMLFEQAHLTYF